MTNRKEQVKKKLKNVTVDDYIKEFNRLLAILEQQAKKKPADKMASTAKDDAATLRTQLGDLLNAQKEGKGNLPILRTLEEWAKIDDIQQRCASFQENNLQKNHKSQSFKHVVEKMKTGGETQHTAPSDNSESTYTSPSPFDISKGPKIHD